LVRRSEWTVRLQWPLNWHLCSATGQLWVQRTWPTALNHTLRRSRRHLRGGRPTGTSMCRHRTCLPTRRHPVHRWKTVSIRVRMPRRRLNPRWQLARSCRLGCQARSNRSDPGTVSGSGWTAQGQHSAISCRYGLDVMYQHAPHHVTAATCGTWPVSQ